MPAYLKELDTQCPKQCGRRGRVEVFNALNSSLGKYCRYCGQAIVKQLNQVESKAEKDRSNARH
jgi:hypothetical protein